MCSTIGAANDATPESVPPHLKETPSGLKLESGIPWQGRIIAPHPLAKWRARIGLCAFEFRCRLLGMLNGDGRYTECPRLLRSTGTKHLDNELVRLGL